MNKKKIKKSILRIFTIYLPVILLAFAVLMPILWALSTSLKSEHTIISSVIQYIPNPVFFKNYANVWNVNHFSIYFKNSVFISFTAVIFIAFLSICNGYAMSRFRFRGKKAFFLMLIGTQLLPIIILIIPLFLIFKTIGIVNTPFSLILFYIVIQTPFSSLLMRGFVDGVPRQIDEAAMIDGATRLQVVFSVIVPIILPGIVAVTAFAFVGCWNEFVAAFSFISTESRFTVPVGLEYMIGEYSVDYASLAAGSIISLIIPLILFSYIQKYLIQGLSSGSVKG